jgi:chromosome segregation ATPase
MMPGKDERIAGYRRRVQTLQFEKAVLDMALAAAKAEIERLQATNAEQAKGSNDLSQTCLEMTHVLAEWIMKHNALEAENATLQTRVEELERLLRLCVPWIDANLVVMETGEFLRPVILKALESQPKKEVPQ